MKQAPMRGQVYRVTVDGLDRKPYVVVSNNTRNRQLDSVLAVRVTTTDKSHVPTAVELTHADSVVGFALADDIVELFDYEIEESESLGALSPKSMLNLNRALMLALGLPD